MSAICPSCGASLPEGAGACAACGAPAPARGDTVVEPLPPGETGPVPVHFEVATARWFGIAPADALLGLAAAAVLAAILLFVTGEWPVGLVAVGLALLLLAAFTEAARRAHAPPFARRSFEAIRAARERAGVAVESAAARTRAQRELARARHELFGIQQRRRTKVFELGEAVLAGDEEAATALKDEVGDLDRLADEKEAELETIASRTREGIERARLSVQRTQITELAPAPKAPVREARDEEPAP